MLTHPAYAYFYVYTYVVAERTSPVRQLRHICSHMYIHACLRVHFVCLHTCLLPFHVVHAHRMAEDEPSQTPSQSQVHERVLICMHMYKCIYMSVCLSVYIYIFVYIYIYIYI